MRLAGKGMDILDSYMDDQQARDAVASALRVSFGTQTIPGIFLMILLVFLPQSPCYLASKGHWNDALSLLAELHGNGDTNHPKVLAHYQELRDEIRTQRLKGEPLVRMLFRRSLRWRFMLGLCVQAWSQLCGVHVILCLSAQALVEASRLYIIVR